ncbi:MAG: hypothetical protein QOK16_1713 [Solirubrobacteraceae bacterium]|nr:hypothetical protein [Solirubrobacteraceae bacterium]
MLLVERVRHTQSTSLRPFYQPLSVHERKTGRHIGLVRGSKKFAPQPAKFRRDEALAPFLSSDRRRYAPANRAFSDSITSTGVGSVPRRTAT